MYVIMVTNNNNDNNNIITVIIIIIIIIISSSSSSRSSSSSSSSSSIRVALAAGTPIAPGARTARDVDGSFTIGVISNWARYNWAQL